MFSVDRERVRRAFADYTDHYDSQNPRIRLKIDHTYRVAALCDAIAKDLELDSEDTDTIWCIGMLHDIGRFEQVRRYDTFSDADSLPHADLGVEILFSEGKIRDYLPDPGRDGLIRTAIACHSLYRLPQALSEKERLFCRIIRDADKIDILKVNTLTPMEEIYGTTREALKQAAITPAVMDAFYEEHTVLRSLRRTPIDHLVSMLSLVYELEFPVSLKIARRQGCIDRLLEFESDNPDTRQKLQAARDHMKEYLARKLARA